MKYVKILGLLAVAAAAMMAFAASASATGVTTDTDPEKSESTPTIHAENSGGHVTLKNALVTISCSSTALGKVENHGGTWATGEIKKENLTFTGCTNSWHVTTLAGGTLEVDHTTGYDGNVRSTGAKVEATRFGLRCVYTTNETAIGTATGGNPATLDISASIPIDPESGASCGTGTAGWSGKYTTTGPIFIKS